MKKCFLASCKLVVILLMLLSSMQIAYAYGSMDVFAYMDDYVAGETVYIEWGLYSGADHYDCTVVNTSTGTYVRSRSSAGKNYSCSVSGSRITAGSYKVWVGAVDTNGDVIADGYAYFTVQAKTDCKHTWEKKTGYCTKCDAECPHNSGVYEIETETICKSISSTQHKLTHAYSEECKICRYVLRKDLTKTETKAHSFDSNGDCKLCDYRASCSHSKTKLEQVSRTCSPYNDTKHNVKIVSNVVCANANCGKLISYGSDIQHEYEEHSMKNGTCTACGYTKQYAPVSVSISRGQASAQVGDTISASCTSSGGSGRYTYYWFVYFNGSQVYSTGDWDTRGSYTATKAGSYSFSVRIEDRTTGDTASATSSTITVTEAVCMHPNTTNVKVDNRVEYIKLSDSKHTVRTYYNVVCTYCHEIQTTIYRDTSEDHTYVSGNCSCCGAADATPCPHPASTATVYSQTTRQFNSDVSHLRVTIWKDVCTQCGVTLNVTRETSERENHRFSGQTCTICGYVKRNECDHADRKTEFISSTTEEADDTRHLVISRYRVSCANCGVLLDADYSEDAYFTHTYENNKCKYCGHEVCSHDLTIRTDGKPYVARNWPDDHQTHLIVTPYMLRCSCGWKSEERSDSIPVKHNFGYYTGYEAHTDKGHVKFYRCECKYVQYPGIVAEYWNGCETCKQKKAEKAGEEKVKLDDDYLEVKDYFEVKDLPTVRFEAVDEQNETWFADTAWQATEKLGDGVQTYIAETIKVTSDMSGSVANLITGALLEGQQDSNAVYVQLWEEMILKLLTEGYTSYATEVGAEADTFTPAFNNVQLMLNRLILGGLDDISDEAIDEYNKVLTQYATDQVGEWYRMLFDEYTEEHARNYDKLFESYDNQLEAAKNRGQSASRTAGVLEGLNNAWKLWDSFGLAKDDAELYVTLTENYVTMMTRLDNISSATTNRQIKEACANVRKNLQAAYEDPVVFSEMKGMMAIAGTTVDIAVGTFVDEIADFALDKAWWLKAVEAASQLADAAGGWTSAYDSQLQLMKISVLDAGLTYGDIAEFINSDDPAYYDIIELYRIVQLEGLVQTKDFLVKYERAAGYDADDFGVAVVDSRLETIDTLIRDNLEDQADIHERFVNLGIASLLEDALEQTAAESSKETDSGCYIKVNNTRCRESANPQSAIVAELAKGTAITILDTWEDANGRTWYRIHANGVTGWIQSGVVEFR